MFKKNEHAEKRRFSIKKYSFGVTSALVGVLLASGLNSAQALTPQSTVSSVTTEAPRLGTVPPGLIIDRVPVTTEAPRKSTVPPGLIIDRVPVTTEAPRNSTVPPGLIIDRVPVTTEAPRKSTVPPVLYADPASTTVTTKSSVEGKGKTIVAPSTKREYIPGVYVNDKGEKLYLYGDGRIHDVTGQEHETKFEERDGRKILVSNLVVGKSEHPVIFIIEGDKIIVQSPFQDAVTFTLDKDNKTLGGPVGPEKPPVTTKTPEQSVTTVSKGTESVTTATSIQEGTEKEENETKVSVKNTSGKILPKTSATDFNATLTVVLAGIATVLSVVFFVMTKRRKNK